MFEERVRIKMEHLIKNESARCLSEDEKWGRCRDDRVGYYVTAIGRPKPRGGAFFFFASELSFF
jgi:hypothetical protein